MKRLSCLLALAALTAGGVASAAPALAAPAAPAASAATVSVVVRGTTPDLGALERLVTAAGGHVERRLALIGGLSATLPSSAVGRLQADPRVREVTPDAPVSLHATDLNGYNASGDADSMLSIENTIGARTLWSHGATGAGVDVALVDSGVAPVPGIDASRVVQGPDLTPESQDPDTAGLDTYGHGTHLAGIIAGHDRNVTDVTRAAKDSTSFLGVAPDARLVSVKAADSSGNSDVSQVIAGIDWVVQHAHDPGMNVRVLNLSFGTDSKQPYVLDPLAYAAEQAWKHGIVTVVSAGNSGAANGRLTDPAIDPFVIAVGADDTRQSTSVNDDTIPAFSARGDGARNPDLVAPGVHVQSLRVPGSYIDTRHGSTAALYGRFFRGSGTSQAAAVVSGAVALVLQQHPAWTPDQVKAALTSAAAALPVADAQAQGDGLVSLRALPATPPATPQKFNDSSGKGTLEGARGSTHLVMTTATGDVTLSGEKDIFGAPVATATLAAQEAQAAAWTGGSFNGRTWAGGGWTSSSWASSAWASSAWASSSWAGVAWASSAWADASWQSSAWASSSWASSAWASSCWASSAWASSAWASSAWADSAWS